MFRPVAVDNFLHLRAVNCMLGVAAAVSSVDTEEVNDKVSLCAVNSNIGTVLVWFYLGTGEVNLYLCAGVAVYEYKLRNEFR